MLVTHSGMPPATMPNPTPSMMPSAIVSVLSVSTGSPTAVSTAINTPGCFEDVWLNVSMAARTACAYALIVRPLRPTLVLPALTM